MLECIVPPITPLSSTSDDLDIVVGYTVIVDDADGPDNSSDELQLTLRANPVIDEVITNEISLPVSSSESVIRISVSQLSFIKVIPV